MDIGKIKENSKNEDPVNMRYAIARGFEADFLDFDREPVFDLEFTI